MSFIDMNTTKGNKQFLDEINQLYSEKSSPPVKDKVIMSRNISEILSQNPIKNQNGEIQKKLSNIEKQLQKIVRQFEQNLLRLTQDISEETKYFRILQMIRKNALLSDISQRINQKTIKHNFSMKRQIEQLKQSILHLSNKPEQRFQVKDDMVQNKGQQNVANKKHVKIDCMKSIPQNIYQQARVMNQQDFLLWCDRILMKDKLVITKLERTRSQTKQNPKHFYALNSRMRSSSQFYSNQTQKTHPQLVQKYQELIHKVHQLSPLIQIKQFQSMKNQVINTIQRIKFEKMTCKNICCQFKKQQLDIDFASNTMYRVVVNENDKNKSQKDFYRNDKMQEYFKRYYQRPDFKVNQIKCVQNTKGQQMNRLQNQYHRMLELRSKKRHIF